MGTTADFYKGLFGTRTRTTAAEPSPRRTISVERARVGSRKWLLFVRCVVVAALVAVFANGVVALARRPDSRSIIRTEASAFPTDTARAYVTRFVAAYLSWDVFSPDTRATALAAFLPVQLARAQVGWNGSGRQKVIAATPSTVEIVGPTEARVIVDVTLEPGGALCVQTAVRSGGNGSLAVVAYPSAVACPAIARQPRPTPPVLEQDANLSGSSPPRCPDSCVPGSPRPPTWRRTLRRTPASRVWAPPSSWTPAQPSPRRYWPGTARIPHAAR
ncbi:conjugal transfer protein [Embleya scabrispora]|uniref:conjugal transfer protein n=1 Tax=Embleya scabrispora TaxID=159449 RepID=UPI00117D427E|nr:conjugal transfer protein [Embleya scabrispora]